MQSDTRINIPKMEAEEKNIYDLSLSNYSSIVQGRIKDREKILTCLKNLEYFEDYEKCEDLKRILNSSQKQPDNINEY